MGTTRIVTEEMFLPDGCDPADSEFHLFAVWVVWKGKGRYAVQWDPGKWADQLSRAGKWAFAPEPFRRHQYRFTYDEACEWAEKVRNDKVVNGRTWAQWQEFRREQEAKQ